MQNSMWKRIFFATLIALAVVFGGHFLGEALYSTESLEKPVYVAETTSDGDKPEDEEVASGDDAKPIGDTVQIGAANNALVLLSSASPEKGANLFKKCKSCHTTKKGGKNTIGPNLWNVVGRAMASNAGFKYSKVLKGKVGHWSFAELDAFLANPKSYAKGTKMSFRGIKKNEDRADLLVYLNSLSDAPKPLP